jgi:hypothetical protein
MGAEDIEQLLKKTKFRHLSDNTLIAYRDAQLDDIGAMLVDAHLRLCLLCERRLTFLKEAANAAESYVINEKDRALIRETVKNLEAETRLTPRVAGGIQKLRSHIERLLADWTAVFSPPAFRGRGDGEQVWKYESEDGLLTAWVVLEIDASLTVHFAATELAWEGARLRFRLGRFSAEATLQREGDGGLTAEIKIPRDQRARKMHDISIEVVGVP